MFYTKMVNIISLILFTLKHPTSSFEWSGCYRFLSTLSQDEELSLMLDCLESIYKELSLEIASHLYEIPLLLNLLSLFGPYFQLSSLSYCQLNYFFLLLSRKLLLPCFYQLIVPFYDKESYSGCLEILSEKNFFWEETFLSYFPWLLYLEV